MHATPFEPPLLLDPPGEPLLEPPLDPTLPPLDPPLPPLEPPVLEPPSSPTGAMSPPSSLAFDASGPGPGTVSSLPPQAHAASAARATTREPDTR